MRHYLNFVHMCLTFSALLIDYKIYTLQFAQYLYGDFYANFEKKKKNYLMMIFHPRSFTCSACLFIWAVSNVRYFEQSGVFKCQGDLLFSLTFKNLDSWYQFTG